MSKKDMRREDLSMCQLGLDMLLMADLDRVVVPYMAPAASKPDTDIQGSMMIETHESTCY